MMVRESCSKNTKGESPHIPLTAKADHQQMNKICSYKMARTPWWQAGLISIWGIPHSGRALNQAKIQP